MTVLTFPQNVTPDRQAVNELIRETPLQLLEIQQHIAPTHRRSAEDGGGQAKPSSRPPLNIDPLDAIQAESAQIIYWSDIYRFNKRGHVLTGNRPIVGTVGERIRYLTVYADIPDWDLDNIMERWMPIRNAHRKIWPTGYERTWISEDEAIAWVGKNVRTLRRWRAAHPAISRHVDGEIMYHIGKLSEVQKAMALAASERIRSVNAQVAA